MCREQQLRQALNYLTNNWRADPRLRQAFDVIFAVLKAGSQQDMEHAKTLRQYLAYPGSDVAMSAVSGLMASLAIPEGRKAAGLVPRKKGRSYSSQMVTPDDEVFKALVGFQLGLVTATEVEEAVTDYIGLNAAPATRKSFVTDLKPRVDAHVEFIRKFTKAAEKKSPL